jgi:hypothetical protein
MGAYSTRIHPIFVRIKSEEGVMVYAFTQDVPIDFETYQKIVDHIGDEPIDGCLVHLCVRREDGGLRYVDVWESEEKCGAAFDERIHPAVDAILGGNRPSQEPHSDRLEVLHAFGSGVSAVSSRAHT